MAEEFARTPEMLLEHMGVQRRQLVRSACPHKCWWSILPLRYLPMRPRGIKLATVWLLAPSLCWVACERTQCLLVKACLLLSLQWHVFVPSQITGFTCQCPRERSPLYDPSYNPSRGRTHVGTRNQSRDSEERRAHL